MKNKLLLTTLILFGINGLSQAQKSEDIKAIKNMCGCFEVKFNFAETFNYSTDKDNYKPSKTKHDWGLEWVELVSSEPNKLVLQHLLLVNDTTIVKHWRQDWLYQNTDLYTYNGFNNWKYQQLDKSQVKGQWTQKVFQVDDSPRYEGTATWIHKDGRHYWENTTDAPLPRREHTVRSDYNVLKRTNLHEITNWGWIHDQDNDKIVRDEKGKDTILAEEKGVDTYTKVADEKCKFAHNWWNANQVLWKNVRAEWDQVFAKNHDLYLEKAVDKKPLFMHIFAMNPNATKTEVKDVINKFVIGK